VAPAAIAVMRPAVQDAVEVLKAGTPALLAAAFTLYTIQYFALSTFLPTFLVDRMGLPLATAGSFSAAALGANALANISAGFFLRLGAPLWAIFAVAFATVGVSGFAIFSATSPMALAAAAATICLGLTALVPSSVIVSMPRFAPTSQRLALSMGLVQQASSIGQLAGPAVLAFWVQWQGWPGVPYLFALICVCGLLITALTWQLRIGTA
jgi:predicted MFS family arabinose efflux permease